MAFDPRDFINTDPETLAREFYDEPMAAVRMGRDDDQSLLVLSDAERDSTLWKRIAARLDARLAELREQNDYTISPLETEKLRGKIEIIKELRSAGLNRSPGMDGEDNPLPGDDLGY